MTSRRRLLLPLAVAASLGAGVAVASTDAERSASVGVLVDLTRGPDPAALEAGRAQVERLRARGTDAELRVVRSPSQALAAAATLTTRGAGTLVVSGPGAEALAPLRDRVRIELRQPAR